MLSFRGNTVILPEEQLLPEEWCLPPDISFVLGKLAKRRWSRTLLAVALRKHERKQP